MNTWTCRAAASALALLGLTGCTEVPGAALLADLRDWLQKDVALSQATMAAGSVTLVAPRGYCIDKKSRN